MGDAGIRIPRELLPGDGRFGCGPSKVPQVAVEALRDAAPGLLGTSHRQPAVKAQVERVRRGLAELFALPDGYEVLLGNGGASLFWDAAVHCLVRGRSAHAVFGEFSSKFAAAARAAPFLDNPHVVEAAAGTAASLEPVDGVDAYALTHCETSTGVAAPIRRPVPPEQGLTLVDATSAAGGLPVAPNEFDAYYFSPQKCFASDGGLWVALCSPHALERITELTAGDRYVPATLDLAIAGDNAVRSQTYNTPALATLFLMGEQLDWLLAQGGLGWAVAQCAAKAQHLYAWAEASDYATPFVADPALRSAVVCTIDLDPSVPADVVTNALRANGIVDTDSYRKLGRNQLRIATFPAIDPTDIEALTASIDYLVERLFPHRQARRGIDEAIVDGYTRIPPTDEEERSAEAAGRQMIAEEPW